MSRQGGKAEVKRQALYLFAVGMQALTSAALIPVLTHELTQADYGRIAFVAVSQQIATTIINLGLPGLVTSWESGGDDRGLQRGAAMPVVALGTACTAVAAALGSSITAFILLLGSLNAVASLILARVAARGRAGIWSALTVGIGPLATALAAGVAVWTGSFLSIPHDLVGRDRPHGPSGSALGRS